MEVITPALRRLGVLRRSGGKRRPGDVERMIFADGEFRTTSAPRGTVKKAPPAIAEGAFLMT